MRLEMSRSLLIVFFCFTLINQVRCTDQLYACGTSSDGRLGINDAGPITDITEVDAAYAGGAELESKLVKKVAVSSHHSVVLTAEHHVVELGTASATHAGETITTTEKVVDIAAGDGENDDGFTAYLEDDGTVTKAGGDIATGVVLTNPVDVVFVKICAGKAHLCALSDAGEMYCIGTDGTGTATTWQLASAADEIVLEMDCGTYHSVMLVRTTDATPDTNAVYVTGIDSVGEVGGSSAAWSAGAGARNELSGFDGTPIHVSAGKAATFVVTRKGLLYGVGTGDLLGAGGDSSIPTLLFEGAGEAFEDKVVARTILNSDAGGDSLAFVLINTGEMYVWGSAGDVFGRGAAAITSPVTLRQHLDNLGTRRIIQAGISSGHALYLPEHTCSWFSQYNQLDYDVSDNTFDRAQGRRDLSVCGQCAGYGEDCAYNIHPAEVYTADFGRSSLGGLCEPTDSTRHPTSANQKKQGKYQRACQLDDWLLSPVRRKDATPATDPVAYYRSDTWLPFPDEADPTAPTFNERVWPNLYARYHVTPPHKFLTLRLVVMTHDVLGKGDNIDLVAGHGTVDNCHLLTVDDYDYQSVRESNPWAIDVSQEEVEANVAEGFCIAVYGDNQYPQKSGPSEFKMRVWWEPDFPDFECALNDATNVKDCFELNGHANSDNSGIAALMQQNLIRLGYADRFEWDSQNNYFGIRLNRRTDMIGSEGSPAGYNFAFRHPSKGYPEMTNGFYWNEEVYVYDGFETNFGFVIRDHYLCNADDGFCGGGDGFVFFVHGKTEGLAASDLEYDCGEGGTVSIDNCETALGTQIEGKDMGILERENMLAVEFDTWHNPDYYDPKQGVEHWWINATEYVSYADNHIAIFAAAQDNAEVRKMSTDHSSDNLIAATPSIPNMSDGNEHEVKIWYLPAFGITHPGTVTIFMDNMERPVLVGEITMEKLHATAGTNSDFDGTLKKWEILTRDGGAYVGFIGSQHDSPQDLTITKWNFNRYPGRVAY